MVGVVLDECENLVYRDSRNENRAVPMMDQTAGRLLDGETLSNGEFAASNPLPRAINPVDQQKVLTRLQPALVIIEVRGVELICLRLQLDCMCGQRKH